MNSLQLSPQAAARELLARRKAVESLIEFTQYTNDLYRPAPHHKLIAKKLEQVANGEITRLIICMPPRHGKSELASRRFPAWYLGRNPSEQIIAASYNADLANDFGREVRNIVNSQDYKNVFDVELAQDSKAANRWHTSKKGMYVAAGVGTAVTGRGANILLIDDPFKDRQEADSELQRQRVWDWYTSTAYTRLMQKGAIVVINCLVGDTKILMSDGSEKPIKNIKIGDVISTYENGKLSTSKVLNWANQGSDYVYSIRMSSGIIVSGNKRHPFLVERDGVLVWKRIYQIQVGDMIVRTIKNGEHIKDSNVQLMNAKHLQNAKDTVRLTTTKQDGQVDIDHHLSILNLNLPHTSNTGMESGKTSTNNYSQNRMESVQFVQLNTEQNIGEINSALIMTTKQELLEDCCVTTATLQSEQVKQQTFYSRPLNTSEFILDEVISIKDAGYEDVFDIQVERTENFIANGLVSHNTRWHDDDLTGRLLEAQLNGGDKWEVLSLSAIDDDGNALWPTDYPIARLEQIKGVLPSRDWNSLYQQDPIPDEGEYFKNEWFLEYDTLPDDLEFYGASDYAVTDGNGDFTEHGIFGIDRVGNLYLADWWFGKSTSDVWIDAKCDLIIKHKPDCWFGESGVIRRSIEPFLARRMNERNAICRIEWLASVAGKESRARGFQGMASMGKIFIPKNAIWKDHVMSQLIRFPAGKHDDAVDVCSLIGRGLEHINAKRAKYVAPKKAYVQHGWMG